MRRPVLAPTAVAVLLLAETAIAQPKRYALESLDGIALHNVAAEPVTFQGRKGLRVTVSEDARRRLERMTPEERNQTTLEQLAPIDGLDFSSGVLEVELAGTPAPGAPEGARGFVGIAFRVQKDRATYDAFYLRPTNGRAGDQLRRNHSTQYIAHPDFPWFRLRKENPGLYESYVDLVPGEWTKVKIEVRGDRARLYVHGNDQPSLIVNDLKSGAQGRGAVALWIGPGTVAHFRNLTVDPAP